MSRAYPTNVSLPDRVIPKPPEDPMGPRIPFGGSSARPVDSGSGAPRDAAGVLGWTPRVAPSTGPVVAGPSGAARTRGLRRWYWTSVLV